MEYFPSALDRPQSDAFADRIEAGFIALGYGLWALELPEEAEFIGYVGLAPPNFEAHFTPAVEVAGGSRAIIGAAGSLARLRAQQLLMASVALTWKRLSRSLSRPT